MIKVEKVALDNGSQLVAEKISSILDSLLQFGFFILAALLPLFFSPSTSEALEMPKQILLVAISAIIFLLWLGKNFLNLEFKFNRSFLAPIILIFLLIYLASALLSKDLYQSLIGFGSSIAESFLTVFVLVLLYFVFVNNVKTSKVVRYLITILSFSLFLSIIYAFLQAMGVYSLGWWPITKSPTFNTIGTHNSLAFLMGLVIILCFANIFNNRAVFWLRGASGFIALTSLLFALFLKFHNVLVVLGIAMIVTVILLIFKKSIATFRPLLLIPMIIIMLAAIFYLIKLPPFKNVPAEVLPSPRLTIDIARETLKTNPILGSGPGTWVVDYTKFKLESVNLTNFWNVRFAKGWSHFLMLPATIGILGTLGWLVLIGWVLVIGIKRIRKMEGLNSSKNSLILSVFVGWFYLVAAQFAYHTNITLQFLFWFFTAMLVALFNLSETEDEITDKKDWEFKVNPASPAASVSSFVFLVIIAGVVIGLYFLGRSYLADVAYNDGLKNILVRGDIRNGIGRLEEASQTNSRLDLYQRTLSQAYFLDVRQRASQTSLQDGAQVQQLRSLIDKMLNSAKLATDISPNNVENWIQRGKLYQSLIGFVGGADDWAKKSFEEAVKLDPSDPFVHEEMARTYFVSVSLPTIDKMSYFSKAEAHVNEAIRLKPDYGPAHVLLATIYEQSGKVDEAVIRLEKSQTSISNDPGLIFQLGYLYYRQNKTNKAQVEFEKATQLVDNFSNARYFLGLIYAQSDRKSRALEQFEKILALNPGNQEIVKIINNIKNDLPALNGVTSTVGAISSGAPEKVPAEPSL